MRLLVYHNRHWKEETKNIKEDDVIILVNRLSKSVIRDYCKINNLSDKIINSLRYFTLNELFEGELDNMKFDYIIGNPPYADDKDSDAGSLYVDIVKKVLPLLKDDGVIDFLTPTTIAQAKKTGLSLSGMKGLKLVDYTVNEYFNVGVNILRWQIDKSYNGKVTVTNKDESTDLREYTELMVDINEKVAFDMFERIKKNKNKLFILDQTTGNNNKQLEQDDTFNIQLNVNRNKNIIHYTKRKPKLYTKKKIAISVSTAYNKDKIFIDKEEYGQIYCCIDVNNYSEKQIQNTLDFLFSEICVNICVKYKLLYNVGTNAILYSFPPIDIDKEYKEKDIIELFNLSEDEVKYLKEK